MKLPQVNEYFELALFEAQKAFEKDEVPVGAVLVSKKENILLCDHNRVETTKDPTAHAELLVIRKAAQHIGAAKLVNCDLYVTLEPCPMCAAAISQSRIRRLYYGAYDSKSGAVDHGVQLFNHYTAHHKPEWYGGICEKKCSKIMKDFFEKLR